MMCVLVYCVWIIELLETLRWVGTAFAVRRVGEVRAER